MRSSTEFPREIVRAMPKAELHVHLEGTVDAATLLHLAERHGVRPPAEDVEGVDAWYRFDGFEMFLERYFTVVGLLRDPEDFALVARNYLATAYEQGATLVNYARVEALEKDGAGAVSGVVVRDLETGDALGVDARVVVNATGPFADGVLRLDRADAPPMIAPSAARAGSGSGRKRAREKSPTSDDDAREPPRDSAE